MFEHLIANFPILFPLIRMYRSNGNGIFATTILIKYRVETSKSNARLIASSISQISTMLQCKNIKNVYWNDEVKKRYAIDVIMNLLSRAVSSFSSLMHYTMTAGSYKKRTIMCTLNVYNNNNRKKVKSKTPCFFKFLVQRIFFFLFIAKKIAFPPNYFNTVFFLCEIITRIQFKLAFLTQNNANRQKNHYNFSLPTETFHCTLHSIRQ